MVFHWYRQKPCRITRALEGIGHEASSWDCIAGSAAGWVMRVKVLKSLSQTRI